MDVLRPKIFVINGRQYRLNTDDCFPDDNINEIQTDIAEKLPSYVERDDTDEEYDDLNIYIEDGQCILKLEVPNIFFGLIIGRNRENLKNLEYQTKTRIKIPSSRENNMIIIKGEQRAFIIAAKSKLNAIIKKARFKQDVTHFISLPMINETVIDNYLKFKKVVLKEFGQCRGISEVLFQDHLQLHLTITCFVLCNAAEIKIAHKLMKDCEETIIKPMNLTSLDVLVSGLDYMNDDPSEVKVLYAKVTNPEIQVLADKIQTFFQDCDLVKPARNDHVKLHVTLMNSRFSQQANIVDENVDNRSHFTFDAKKIVEIFDNYIFGMVHLTEIHLSQRHTIDSNGYYKSSFVIQL
ncbi:Protein kinase A anchor protein, nuclear localisation signal domain,Activating signal cointegrator [Cinara cedri]|uniref:Protein kinase A anchor protein, nuclear localisation signal domain,Activating signal cointegrator n=1 Tax=Cinara cedri TaxID=506608 RepID=A0A5E4M2K3_9HEMI|nr:Protein kinase A anchor protein, nuclear localisation signal domain,Activating signal cointegrator [Cinara cedri]